MLIDRLSAWTQCPHPPSVTQDSGNGTGMPGLTLAGLRIAERWYLQAVIGTRTAASNLLKLCRPVQEAQRYLDKQVGCA